MPPASRKVSPDCERTAGSRRLHSPLDKEARLEVLRVEYQFGSKVMSMPRLGTKTSVRVRSQRGKSTLTGGQDGVNGARLPCDQRGVSPDIFPAMWYPDRRSGQTGLLLYFVERAPMLIEPSAPPVVPVRARPGHQPGGMDNLPAHLRTAPDCPSHPPTWCTAPATSQGSKRPYGRPSTERARGAGALQSRTREDPSLSSADMGEVRSRLAQRILLARTAVPVQP
jgi:hypothetical protein